MEKVLLDTILGLPSKGYTPLLLINSKGHNQDWQRELRDRGITYRNIDITSKTFFLNIRRAYRLFNEYNADIIHFFLGSATSCQSAITGAYIHKYVKNKKMPVLVASEQLDSKEIIDALPIDRLLLKKITLAMLSHIICVSKQVQNSLADYFKMNRDKSSIIYNCVDTNKCIQHTAKNIIKEIAVPIKNKIVFIVPARLEPIKGHIYLLQAILKIREQIPESLFLFLGDGGERNKIFNFIKENNLNNTIHLIGFKNNVIDYLKNSDVFVLPSISEGFPLSVLEAMACGLPVISTKISGVSELIQDGRTGLLVPPKQVDPLASGLVQLYNQKEKRKSLGKAAQNIVREKYDTKYMLNKIDKLYRDLLPKQNRTAFIE